MAAHDDARGPDRAVGLDQAQAGLQHLRDGAVQRRVVGPGNGGGLHCQRVEGVLGGRLDQRAAAADQQRRATQLAGSYAGLDVVGVLSEPIAAALSYGFGRLDGGACRRVADAFGLPLGQVRRAVEIQVDTVVSRGFGVLAVNPASTALEASWLVHRNDRLPIRVRRSYGTMRADQVEIHVTVVEQQGQVASPRPADAKILMVGVIEGIPRGYDEGSEVRITVEMGFDGVLHVTAHHVDADKPLQLSAQTGATLSQAEVARERSQVERSRRRES